MDNILPTFAVFIMIMILAYGLDIFGSNQNVVDNDFDYDEPFVGKYYHLNWNDPRMVSKMNAKNSRSSCGNCKYSEMCNLTDDANPSCYKSYDVPRYDKKTGLLFGNNY